MRWRQHGKWDLPGNYQIDEIISVLNVRLLRILNIPAGFCHKGVLFIFKGTMEQGEIKSHRTHYYWNSIVFLLQTIPLLL